jgi:hypothetical protein
LRICVIFGMKKKKNVNGGDKKMPGGDGSGPEGHGPMTGRKLGLCAGYSTPGYSNPSYGRGLGRGWGRGIGRGYWRRGRGFWWRGYSPEPYNAPMPSREEEKTYLENLVKTLEDELKAVKDRLQDLIKEKKNS